MGLLRYADRTQKVRYGGMGRGGGVMPMSRLIYFIGSPPALMGPLFHGQRAQLRLGVTGIEPLRDWTDFPTWRRYFNAWRTRATHRPTKFGGRDERFNITLPDQVLERLGATFGLNVSHSHVEVVLSGYAVVSIFRFASRICDKCPTLVSFLWIGENS